MTISKNLEDAHCNYVEARREISYSKGFDVSVSIAEVAYGQADNIATADAYINKLEAGYRHEIKGWRKALTEAGKCLEIRKTESR